MARPASVEVSPPAVDEARAVSRRRDAQPRVGAWSPRTILSLSRNGQSNDITSAPCQSSVPLLTFSCRHFVGAPYLAAFSVSSNVPRRERGVSAPPGRAWERRGWRAAARRAEAPGGPWG